MSTDCLLWYLTYQVGAEQAEHLLDVSQLVVFRDMGGGDLSGTHNQRLIGTEYLTAEDIVAELSATITNSSRFNINVWDGAIRGFKGASFDPSHEMSVKFTDDEGQTEDGVDTGGPKPPPLSEPLVSSSRFFGSTITAPRPPGHSFDQLSRGSSRRPSPREAPSEQMGQGVVPVAVVGVGPLGTGVVLALLEGNHSCPGGILVGHGVEEDEDDLVSMGVVWVVVQWGAFLLLRQSSQFSPVAPSLLSQLPHLVCQSGQPCHVTLSVLLQLSHLSPHGGQLSPVAVSVLPQLGELCADGRRVLLDPGVLGWLLADQLSQLYELSLQLCEFNLQVSDGAVQLGVLGWFWTGGPFLRVSSGAARNKLFQPNISVSSSMYGVSGAQQQGFQVFRGSTFSISCSIQPQYPGGSFLLSSSTHNYTQPAVNHSAHFLFPAAEPAHQGNYSCVYHVSAFSQDLSSESRLLSVTVTGVRSDPEPFIIRAVVLPLTQLLVTIGLYFYCKATRGRRPSRQEDIELDYDDLGVPAEEEGAQGAE
ncbi:hypothetical protein F7725_012240 [Dissostichus mawsoni]|uniref:Uncharacterized protein n=1 Tax=Dissostichus mawsoni TaxID=36200 RepID=A0A7J5YQB4_DISMA|nr:hypothetical protein F7725_012240 [Dissostichus mawsoni]